MVYVAGARKLNEFKFTVTHRPSTGFASFRAQALMPRFSTSGIEEIKDTGGSPKLLLASPLPVSLVCSGELLYFTDTWLAEIGVF